MINARIAIPSSATRGDLVQIKTLVSHPMESGYRYDAMGIRIPQNILKHFRCEYLGHAVFEMEFGPAVAANPFLTFFFRASESGALRFIWRDQNGEQSIIEREIHVTDEGN